MARRKLINTNPNQLKGTDRIHVKLDRESLKIWNTVKYKLNISDWMRTQLKFHFSEQLTNESKMQILREEIGALNRWKKEAEIEIDSRYNSELQRLQKLYCSEEVSIIINPAENTNDNLY